MDTSTILPLGRPPPNAKSSVKQPLGKVSLQEICYKVNSTFKSYPKYSMLDCLMHLAKTHNKQSNINRTLHSFYLTLHKMKGNISPGRKKSKNTEIKQMECYGRMRTLTPMLHQHSPIL